jgi:Kef-type K+ transport system membrane component KefB
VRIILGAAVVDDVIGLTALAVVNSWGQDDINVVELTLTAAIAVAFVAFAALVGTRAIKRYSVHLEKLHIANAPFAFAMLLMLGLSALAGEIGLAAIIGAFLAGMMLAEAEESLELRTQARGVFDFLVPFFFVIIGTQVDLAVFEDAEVVAIAIAVTTLAVATKFAAGLIAARGLGCQAGMVIGTGMVPRGEVGFVVAGVGAGIGAVSDDMYSVVVFMSIATTLLAPPVLVRLYREREPAPAAATAGIPEG